MRTLEKTSEEVSW